MHATTPSSSTPVRILLADDYQPWCQSVRSMLAQRRELDIVAEVANGLEAVQKAQELQPDLILLDIGLSHLNGIVAASQIAKVAPRARILFVTQNSDSDIVRAALNNGAKGYVLTADAGRDLLPAIETVLRGEKFLSEGLKS